MDEADQARVGTSLVGYFQNTLFWLVLCIAYSFSEHQSYLFYLPTSEFIKPVETCGVSPLVDSELLCAKLSVGGGSSPTQGGDGSLTASPRRPVVLLQDRGDHAGGRRGSVPLSPMGVPWGCGWAKRRARSGSKEEDVATYLTVLHCPPMKKCILLP